MKFSHKSTLKQICHSKSNYHLNKTSAGHWQQRRKGRKEREGSRISEHFLGPLLLPKADEHVRALEVGDDDDGGVSPERQMSHMRFWQMERGRKTG